MQAPNPIQRDAETAGEGVSALVRMIGLFFGGLRILLVAMFLYLVFGGMFYVEQDKAAMLFRFGKLTPRDGKEILRSGAWYWALPYPIDRVVKVPAARSVTIATIQFWPQEDPNRIRDANKAAPSGDVQPLQPGTDGYLLTGDANILHMAWTMTYRVADVKRYYLDFQQDPKDAQGKIMIPVRYQRGVERTIESALVESVLAEVATRTVEDALFLARGPLAPGVTALLSEGQPSRESLINSVRRRVISRLDELKVGIEVQQVSMAEIQPPLCTQQAFRDVLAAATDKQAEMDKALAAEKRTVTEAEGSAAQLLADARAYKTRTVESVKASAGYFEKLLVEYRKSPDTVLIALYTDAIRDVLSKSGEKYIVHGGDGANQTEVRLSLGPEPEKAKHTVE